MSAELKKICSPSDKNVSPATKALVGCGGQRASKKQRARAISHKSAYRKLNEEDYESSKHRIRSKSTRRVSSKLRETQRRNMKGRNEFKGYKSPSDKITSPIARVLIGDGRGRAKKKDRALTIFRNPEQLDHDRSSRRNPGFVISKAAETPREMRAAKRAQRAAATLHKETKRRVVQEASSNVKRSKLSNNENLMELEDEQRGNKRSFGSASRKKKKRKASSNPSALNSRPINVRHEDLE